MVWDRRVRRIAWAFFFLMWFPLGAMFYAAVTEDDEVTVITALGLFFFLCVLFAILMFGSFAIGRYEKERIKRNGIPAKAAVISITGTGTRINDQPLLRFELEVQPPYDSRFRATVEYVVADLPDELWEGSTVQVYYTEGTHEVALADL